VGNFPWLSTDGLFLVFNMYVRQVLLRVPTYLPRHHQRAWTDNTCAPFPPKPSPEAKTPSS
jgi:hypothetical protein